MENAILVMIIVILIILLALLFFVFQVWVQSKESKLQLANLLQELLKGFSNTDGSLKITTEQLAANLVLELRALLAAIDVLKDQMKLTDMDIKKSKEEINEQTTSRIGELSRNIKILNEQLDERMKEMDKHLTVKLVADINNISKDYFDRFSTKQLAYVGEVAKTSKEIKEEQKRLFQAITEPLRIKTD